MKLRLSILVYALFLAYGAMAAELDPATSSTESVQPIAVDIPAAADCAVSELSTPLWLETGIQCGSCSDNPCKLNKEGAVCGFAGGVIKFCQTIPGIYCIQDGLPRCRCTALTPASDK